MMSKTNYLLGLWNTFPLYTLYSIKKIICSYIVLIAITSKSCIVIHKMMTYIAINLLDVVSGSKKVLEMPKDSEGFQHPRSQNKGGII